MWCQKVSIRDASNGRRNTVCAAYTWKETISKGTTMTNNKEMYLLLTQCGNPWICPNILIPHTIYAIWQCGYMWVTFKLYNVTAGRGRLRGNFHIPISCRWKNLAGPKLIEWVGPQAGLNVMAKSEIQAPTENRPKIISPRTVLLRHQVLTIKDNVSAKGTL